VTADQTPGPSWLDRAAAASIRAIEAKDQPSTVREYPTTPLLGYPSLTWRALHVTEGTPDPSTGDPLPLGWSVVAETPAEDGGHETVIWMHVLDALTPDDQDAHQQVAEVTAQALAELEAAGLHAYVERIHADAERRVDAFASERDRLQGLLDDTRAELAQVRATAALPNLVADYDKQRAIWTREVVELRRYLATARETLADVLDPRRRQEQELIVQGIRQDGAILHGTAAEWADWTARAQAAGASIPAGPAPAADTTVRF
jgi:hypothetical protein